MKRAGIREGYQRVLRCGVVDRLRAVEVPSESLFVDGGVARLGRRLVLLDPLTREVEILGIAELDGHDDQLVQTELAPTEARRVHDDEMPLALVIAPAEVPVLELTREVFEEGSGTWLEALASLWCVNLAGLVQVFTEAVEVSTRSRVETKGPYQVLDETLPTLGTLILCGFGHALPFCGVSGLRNMKILWLWGDCVKKYANL